MKDVTLEQIKHTLAELCKDQDFMVGIVIFKDGTGGFFNNEEYTSDHTFLDFNNQEELELIIMEYE